MLGKLYDDIFVIDMSKSYLEHLRPSGNILIQNEHILEPEDQLEAKSQDLFGWSSMYVRNIHNLSCISPLSCATVDIPLYRPLQGCKKDISCHLHFCRDSFVCNRMSSCRG